MSVDDTKHDGAIIKRLRIIAHAKFSWVVDSPLFVHPKIPSRQQTASQVTAPRTIKEYLAGK